MQKTVTAGWKKLVSTTDTISYIKEKQDHSIIIEARHYDAGWEIVKKYTGTDINFVEQYSASSGDELKRLLGKLKDERELSINEIKTLSIYRKKNLKIDLKRAYTNSTNEKWLFGLNGNYTNILTIHHGPIITLDVIMEEKLKYIEEKIVMKLFESLGLDESEKDTELSIYYFTKKTTYFFENEEEEILLS